MVSTITKLLSENTPDSVKTCDWVCGGELSVVTYARVTPTGEQLRAMENWPPPKLQVTSLQLGSGEHCWAVSSNSKLMLSWSLMLLMDWQRSRFGGTVTVGQSIPGHNEKERLICGNVRSRIENTW